MTTLLPPTEVGKAALVTTGTAFFALFLINPVGMFINRRLHSWVDAGRVKSNFHAFCAYVVTVAAIASLISWWFVDSGVIRLEMKAYWFAGLVAASLVFNTVNQTLVPSLNMLGRAKPFVALTISTLLLGLLASVSLVRFGGASAALWLSGPLISQVIFSWIAYKTFFKGHGSSLAGVKRADYKRLFDFCWPISIAVGLNWLHFQGYRFVLAEKFGLADMGLFAAGYGLSTSLMAAIESICTTWFQPRFYRETNSANADLRSIAWSNYARFMLPLSMLAVTGIIVTAPYLTKIMLGPDYASSSRYVVVGAFAEWIRMLTNIFGLSAHQRMRTRALILPSLVGAFVLGVGLLFVLHQHELQWAPIAAAAGGAFMCACLYIDAKRCGQGMSTDYAAIARFAVATSIMAIFFLLLRGYCLFVFGLFEPLIGMVLAALMWCGAAIVLLKTAKRYAGNQ